jgi:hypothetical protein
MQIITKAPSKNAMPATLRSLMTFPALETCIGTSELDEFPPEVPVGKGIGTVTGVEITI